MEESYEVIEVQEDAKVDGITYREVRDPYGFIYITTNLVNGKKYLGQKKFDRKWKDYLGSGHAFKEAINKYGEENFSRSIIHICYSAEELSKVEYELSVFFNVVQSEDWYNLSYGGAVPLGVVVTEETRAKLSASRRKNSIIHPEFDARHSKKMVEFYNAHPEAKEQSRNRLKQLWQDPEYVEKMAQHSKDYWSDPDNRKKRSEMLKEIWKDPNVRDARLKGLREWNQNPDNKIIRSELAKKNWEKPGFRENQIVKQSGSNSKMYGVHKYGVESNKYFPVYCIELDQIFWGATQASKDLKIHRSDIAQCCKKTPGHLSAGKHPVTGEKLHWLYINDFVLKNEEIIQGAISLGYVTKEQIDEYLNSLKQKENDIYGEIT